MMQRWTNFFRAGFWLMVVGLLASSITSRAQVANGAGFGAGWGQGAAGGVGGGGAGGMIQPGIRYVTYPAPKAFSQILARDFFGFSGVNLTTVSVPRPIPSAPARPAPMLVRRPMTTPQALARARASSTPGAYAARR